MDWFVKQNQDDLFQLSSSGAGEGTAIRQGTSSNRKEKGKEHMPKPLLKCSGKKNPFPEPAHDPRPANGLLQRLLASLRFLVDFKQILAAVKICRPRVSCSKQVTATPLSDTPVSQKASSPVPTTYVVPRGCQKPPSLPTQAP